MSALKLFTSRNTSCLFRNLKNFSCALSPGNLGQEWPRRTQDQRRSSLQQEVLSFRRQYCTKKSAPDATKHTIPGFKIDEKESGQDLAHSLVNGEDSRKLSLFKRFKLMYKQYWYVLIPVHVVTSVGWFGAFYYMSQSGVDVPALLQTLHIGDTIVDKVKESSMGHVAIAYLIYKIATPVRYAVTLGGTTYAINYLSRAGHIKPVPTKDQLMKIYEVKKADMAKRKQERSKDKS